MYFAKAELLAYHDVCPIFASQSEEGLDYEDPAAQAEKIAIETIQTKLMLLRENADVYKAMHGEELYNKMVVDLLNKMMGAKSSGMGETPVSAVSAISSQRSSDIDCDDANNDDEE